MTKAIMNRRKLHEEDEQVGTHPVNIGHPPLAEHGQVGDEFAISDGDRSKPLRMSKTLSNASGAKHVHPLR